MAVVAKVRPETFMRCKYYLYIRGDANAGIMNQRQAIARGLVVWGWCGLFSAEEYCRAECVYVRIRRREIELAPNLWLQDAHDDVDDDDDSIWYTRMLGAMRFNSQSLCVVRYIYAYRNLEWRSPKAEQHISTAV